MQILNGALCCRRRAFISSTYAHTIQLYSTSPPPKSPVKLIAELRKLTDVSITKAREALLASNNNFEQALEWIRKDLAISGAKKAAKVAGRATGEGVISTVVLSRGAGSGGAIARNGGSLRAAMVELNCETDFVGRNELFGKLAADIATTAAVVLDPVAKEEAVFHACPLDVLNDAPLISSSDPQPSSSSTTSVGTAIRDTIAKVGENISLRRAITVGQSAISPSQPEIGLRLASYTHGASNDAFPNQGRIGTLAVLALKSPKLAQVLHKPDFIQELERLERSIARQIVGFPTLSVRSQTAEEDETALYEQPFMMFPGELNGQPVQQVLRSWAKLHRLAEEQEEGGLEVLEFAKWTVGGVI